MDRVEGAPSAYISESLPGAMLLIAGWTARDTSKRVTLDPYHLHNLFIILIHNSKIIFIK